ncbi:MAG: DUF2065 domain-containing protein [Spongiibacter sp.]|jgi:uncharacterized protein YjeT (DUF2065 family)|uniref:DUF2065 domain-containing protein n=1 Tax=uncultured Spongiibacter sp. TaxID=870896 RepID=UPI000C0A31E9|nr:MULTISPECIES: DUF2065 family protein [Spongiibacter]MAK43752.1 DUF2065 domain-containing protein [Spongiibacter sp.]|tara:strand:+ start:3646 stop:3831 length:186 start_codon:yes stop_codon:yes gene_type:complete
MWQELAVALSLVLIIEGILPFLSPDRWRMLAYRMADLDSRSVRWVGLLSMVTGLLMLSVLR